MTTTTTIEHFLRELRASDIRIVLRDERVHVSAPSGALTDEVRQQLSERRDEALAYLLAARSRAESGNKQASTPAEPTICPSSPTSVETAICPSSPAAFVSEVDALTHTMPGSPLALELATTGPDPRQDRVVAIALNLAGRVTILDLRHYTLLPAEEQAAWRGALQCLFQPGWRTWVGQDLARSWLFLLHHFGVRLDPIYDPLLVEQVLAGQNPGRERPRPLAEVATRYQRVLPASELAQLELPGEGSGWFAGLDQRPVDWSAPLPENEVRALTQTCHVLARLVPLQQEALQRRSLVEAAQIENNYLPAHAALEARTRHLEQWLCRDTDPPVSCLLKADLAGLQEFDQARQITIGKIALTILNETLPTISVQVIRATSSDILLECPSEQIEDATRLVQEVLAAACLQAGVKQCAFVPVSEKGLT